MNLKETYNKIAEEWHEDHQDDSWWIGGTDKFISLLNPKDSVLDVGCGAGTKSAYLIEKGLQVTGIDFSEKMIDIARHQVQKAKFQVLDLANIDELADSFDGIFMQAVLLHVPKAEAEERIKNIAKKLMNGGYFYIAVKEKWPDQVEEETKIENDYGYEYERFFSYFTLGEIRKYFIDSGFTLDSCI
jgi:SAM-dependent methyltransferase